MNFIFSYKNLHCHIVIVNTVTITFQWNLLHAVWEYLPGISGFCQPSLKELTVTWIDFTLYNYKGKLLQGYEGVEKEWFIFKSKISCGKANNFSHLSHTKMKLRYYREHNGSLLTTACCKVKIQARTHKCFILCAFIVSILNWLLNILYSAFP